MTKNKSKIHLNHYKFDIDIICNRIRDIDVLFLSIKFDNAINPYEHDISK